jgi:hypothetical protein
MLTRVLPLMALVTTTLALAVLPANAQGFKIKTNALEKVDWYHAPKEYQILNAEPNVVDHRTGPATPDNFTINLGRPNAGGRVPGAGALVPVSGLPKSGFGSNIPAAGMAQQSGLPAASSTNMLAGKYAKPATAPARPGSLLKSARSTPAAFSAPQPVKTASYGATYPSSGGAFGSSTTKSTTSVSGVVKRGTLLQK